MQYSFVAAAVLAFTSSVFAQTAGFAVMTVPSQDQNVEAGSTLDITWAPSTTNTGAITIQLLQGASPSTLEIGETIAASIDQTTGKFAWTVPKDLKSFATYGFKITLDSTKSNPNPVFQFSFPFHITGLSGSSSASAYATGGTTTVHLSTGTGYTAKPTTTSISSYVLSSASVNSTSTYVPVTTYSASTSGSGAVVYPTANVTLSTTLRPTASASGSGTASGTTAPAATVTGNSASSIARGGLAVAAGMVLAFAL
ncbi:Ser-Thr-rich glycosyl-phosphatidyl-inositol-anchored membrane family-domain-containing protein [Leptodontidium sp. 2 PMI_412]|nr:Ser-Thr-rich glycosyl-phosphatidyl-inositol-anchored membrane family-domain-containing protein [Leptodontidium sp. 2 PMI_412]